MYGPDFCETVFSRLTSDILVGLALTDLRMEGAQSARSKMDAWHLKA
jgi:hypothetical protein